jgi:hypothetical protein
MIVITTLLLAGPLFADDNGTPCQINDDCAPTEFCSTEASGTCGGEGQCVPRGANVMCMTTCQPVCGCDGQTYLNPCVAHKHGASIAQQSPCP